MWLLIGEMLLALALLVFIVWWVAVPSRDPRRGTAEDADRDA